MIENKFGKENGKKGKPEKLKKKPQKRCQIFYKQLFITSVQKHHSKKKLQKERKMGIGNKKERFNQRRNP